ncbi:MAG TPA: hypothetical protein VJ485_02070 [archaeon]|nr:hypothetical protein [archaeon]
MSVTKYIEIVWMNLIGIGFVSAGLYMIIFLSSGNAIYNPMGFILMVMGLFFSTIGGFYGKKKLLQETNPVSMESRQLDQIKQNVVSQVRPAQVQAQAPKEPEPAIEKEGGKASFKPESKVMVTQAAEPQPGQVVKIMVCPGCDTENPPSNMFCFNCGKRLKSAARRATAAAGKRARTSARRAAVQ